MKLIYVAGPFRAANAWEVEQNIRRAEELALKVWQTGYAAICPHANTRFFSGAAPDEIWLQGDIEILSRCDAVILCDKWWESPGTLDEVRQATISDIPVYDSIPALEARQALRPIFLSSVCNGVHPTAALQLLKTKYVDAIL